jgi:carboxymethylenebutenolidase
VRIISRILGFSILLIALLLVLVVASVFVDQFVGGHRIQASTNATIPAPETAPGRPAVYAYVARPPADDDQPWPAVIMIHEFWGIQPSIAGKAEALAQEGYVVAAPDTYRGAVTNWLPRAIYLSASTPTARVNADLDTVFAWLAQQPDVDPERIMVVGFCYGGGKALRYSLHNPRIAATGVFYGSLISDPAVLRRLPGPVLGIFGAEDRAPSPEQVAAFEAGLQAADIPHQLTIYPGVGHAFVTDVASIRQGGAQGAAWQEFLDFLTQTFNQ